MAGLLGRVTSGEVSVSTTAKTVLQIIAPANHRVVIKSLSLFFKGTSPTGTPVRVRLLRQTTAGTMTSVTPAKNDSADDETLQTTAAKDASAEPTAGDVLETWEIHPQTGLKEYPPFGMEWVIPGGTRLGIEVLAAEAQTVAANLLFEE